MRPIQFHRLSLARMALSSVFSRTSPAIVCPEILVSILDTAPFSLLRTCVAYFQDPGFPAMGYVCKHANPESLRLLRRKPPRKRSTGRSEAVSENHSSCAPETEQHRIKDAFKNHRSQYCRRGPFTDGKYSNEHERPPVELAWAGTAHGRGPELRPTNKRIIIWRHPRPRCRECYQNCTRQRKVEEN